MRRVMCEYCETTKHEMAMASGQPNMCVTCLKKKRKEEDWKPGFDGNTKCMNCSSTFQSPHKFGLCTACKATDTYKFGETYAISM